MESNTKTIAKRARVEPRTQVHMTRKMLFQIMFVSNKCLGITIIVLDNILKLWIELIKSRNGNATEKFYGLWTFQKLIFLVKISEVSKFFENNNFIEGGALALRVIRAGTRLTVHRSLPSRKVVTRRVETFFLLEERLVEWKYSSFSKSNDSQSGSILHSGRVVTRRVEVFFLLEE